MEQAQGLDSAGLRPNTEKSENQKALEALLAAKVDTLYCWTCHFDTGDVMIVTAGRELALYVAEMDKRVEEVIEWRLDPGNPLSGCIYRREGND